ncbi:MAG TPA: sulfite exporter TauE/SafE family protein [Actinomycetota bacterium]|jgi:uncharacterized membrane protein YfcA|nr:sulfite exporter TauE/SafE family protein [Actinomycetota bacterium]
MTPLRAAAAVLVGLVAGVLSGLFGVGGSIVTTPAINVLLGGTAIQAVGTPLPVTFPTALAGAVAYARARQLSWRAFRWAAIPGIAGAVGGAWLTDFVNPHILLVITAVLIGWTAVRVVRGRPARVSWELGKTQGWIYGMVGLVAGFVSGLLGVGGGIIFVPAFALLIGMPLKRSLGTSLVTITAIVIPGTVVHGLLGHIDWAIALFLTVGVIPGASLGARIALRTRDRTLRGAVGAFLMTIAVLYGIREVAALLAGRG